MAGKYDRKRICASWKRISDVLLGATEICKFWPLFVTQNGKKGANHFRKPILCYISKWHRLYWRAIVCIWTHSEEGWSFLRWGSGDNQQVERTKLTVSTGSPSYQVLQVLLHSKIAGNAAIFKVLPWRTLWSDCNRAWDSRWWVTLYKGVISASPCRFWGERPTARSTTGSWTCSPVKGRGLATRDRSLWPGVMSCTTRLVPILKKKHKKDGIEEALL